MAGPIAVDTPDYQRGVVSAQKLLATVAAGTDHVTVGIPPNAESIIVTADSFSTPPVVYCEGVSTLYKYDGVHGPQKNLITVADTWAFDVSYPMDQQVTVQFSETPSDQWYVYADSAARVQFDGSGRYDNEGSQFVIPTVPNTAAGDHPPIELQVASLLNATNGTGLIAAPGGGQRIRVFDAFVNGTSTSAFVALRTSATSKQIIGLGTSAGNTAGRISGYPSGLPMPAGEGVNLVVTAGNVDGTVTYTVEEV